LKNLPDLKHNFLNFFPSPNLFLFRILFTVPATWQCVDHKNVVIPEALRQSSAGQTGD
jgi:hypothetical protein